MKHADTERSLGLWNDDCPFCDHTDEHEHQVKHIRRRDLLHALHGTIPLRYHPRQKPRHNNPSISATHASASTGSESDDYSSYC